MGLTEHRLSRAAAVDKLSADRLPAVFLHSSSSNRRKTEMLSAFLMILFRILNCLPKEQGETRQGAGSSVCLVDFDAGFCRMRTYYGYYLHMIATLVSSQPVRWFVADWHCAIFSHLRMKFIDRCFGLVRISVLPMQSTATFHHKDSR